MKKLIEYRVRIPVRFEIKKEGIVCKNRATFMLIWGAKSNPFDVGIKEREDGLLITHEQLKQRKIFLEERIKRYQDSLESIKDFEKEYQKRLKLVKDVRGKK